MKLARVDIVRIAAEADCDPRTVEAYIEGRSTGRVAERVAKAMAKLSIVVPAQRGVA